MTFKGESVSISMLLSGAGVLLLILLTTLVTLAWDGIDKNDTVHTENIKNLTTSVDSLRFQLQAQAIIDSFMIVEDNKFKDEVNGHINNEAIHVSQ
ncbi:MAG: hypothetical protein KAS32_12580 [Candidatus Peribacteraceae bacterium]|nr:hypothetical protein [Candidatus Peribacteraceae bacterium]